MINLNGSQSSDFDCVFALQSEEYLSFKHQLELYVENILKLNSDPVV